MEFCDLFIQIWLKHLYAGTKLFVKPDDADISSYTIQLNYEIYDWNTFDD